jgi:hypothetical protein
MSTMQLDEQFRATFRDGWTDDDIDSVLAQIQEDLGVQLRCVWEYVDDYGCGGHSDLIMVRDGQPCALPDGLWDFLVDGAGDGQITGQVVAEACRYDDADINLAALEELYASAQGYNLVREDRT